MEQTTATKVLEQLERVTTRPGVVLMRDEQIVIGDLNTDQRRRYEVAKTTGFIETKQLRTGHPEIDIINAYWRWCVSTDRPVVELRRGHRYARVSVDLGMTSHRLDDEQIRAIRRRFHAAAVLTRRWCHLGPDVCVVEQVKIEDAALLASWLVEHCQN